MRPSTPARRRQDDSPSDLGPRLKQDHEVTLLQAGERLLNGWGYQWYRKESQIRADDLLVRHRASTLLGQALAALHRAEVALGRVPRKRPGGAVLLPVHARAADLQVLGALVARLDHLRAALGPAAMAQEDRLAARLRHEAGLLAELVACDCLLAVASDALDREAAAIAPGAIADLPARLEPKLVRRAAVLERRRALVSVARDVA